MLNPQFKEEYIEQSLSRNLNIAVSATKMFEHIGKAEDKLGKDLKDFTVSEILDFYNGYCTSSLESLMMMNSNYKLYTSYCLSRNLVKDNQNHYEEITQQLLGTCLNYGLTKAKIISKKELDSLLDLLHNPSDKFIVLAMFEGISGEEMCELVDLEFSSIKGNTISLSTGRTLKISQQLIYYAKESANEYVYYAFKADGDIRELNYATDDPYILKRMYNADEEASASIKRQRLYSKLMRVKNYLGSAAIGKKSLMESGRIHMIKKFMKEQNINVENAIKYNRESIEYRYGKLTSISRYLLKYGEFYEEE